MLFNSISFALFLPVVFFLYWFVFNKKLSQQNAFLLAASYFFYSCWDVRFLGLLLFSTLLDFYTGLQLEKVSRPGSRKKWLWASIVINLGLLGVFKYYNFFADSFADFVTLLGFRVHPVLLQWVLPIGISFYTFHGLSYVIDLYHRRSSAEKNFIDYAVFVSFFPLLVAGPIERANHLLPQIKQPRRFNTRQATEGLRQILWGLFKKMVIADNCAQYANIAFDPAATHSGSTLLLGAFFFTMQIYGDFSGYSDIAIGTARLLGIELLRNFAFPYFAPSIAAFWRRWHISLSSWFRDYVYIPLGGNKGSFWKRSRNILITFLLSGFWHGAKWNFLAWGLLHGLLLILSSNFRKKETFLPKQTIVENSLLQIKVLASILFTFCLTMLTWVLFRAEDISHSFRYIKGIFSGTLFSGDFRDAFQTPAVPILVLCALIGFLFTIEWVGRAKPYALDSLEKGWRRPVRYSFYYFVLGVIFLFSGEEQAFIYFQF